MQFCSALWLEQSPDLSHPLNQRLNEFYHQVFLDSSGENPNAFVKQSIAFDRQVKQLYMSMPEELAARCFEKCIAMHPDIKNSFLVSELSTSGLI